MLWVRSFDSDTKMSKVSKIVESPVWARYRDQFPVTQKLIYMNHAGVTPLCVAAAQAMRHLTGDAELFGSHHYDQWLENYEGLRVAAARLIGAHRDEIAIIKNTSEGVATVAIGFVFSPGDRVVVFEEEFPANWYPWKRLEARGVTVTALSIHDPLDRIDEACRGARLLAISFVQYLSGFRVDLNAIGEICRRNGCIFFVDAIQGLGAFPLDVRAAGIHALAADGHKWMLGPEGCGILYIQRDLQDSIEPVEFGYTNVRHFTDYGARQTDLRPDAGRYEPGTLNTVGIYGLRAAIEFLLEVGIEEIAPHVQALGDQIAQGVERKGYEVMVERTPSSGAGIVSFRKPGVDSRGIVKHLRDRGIVVAARSGWIRSSPHFYISPDDVETLVRELP